MVLSNQPMGLSEKALRTIPRYRERGRKRFMWAARLRSMSGYWFLWGDGIATMHDDEFQEMWEPANDMAIQLLSAGGWSANALT